MLSIKGLGHSPIISIFLTGKLTSFLLNIILLKFKLKELEKIKETGNVRLCFGSNKLFRQQFQINSDNKLTQFKTHSQ